MKTIIQKDRRCFLCGRNGASDPLDLHHIFGGPYRKKSDRYGLTVYLCHNACHIFGPNAVHNNRAQDLRLKQIGQKAWMEQNGKTTEEFIKEFGRNYV